MDETAIAFEPTVTCIPTHPVKSFRSVPGVDEVTKLVPAVITVSVAAVLVTEACVLVTTTRNCVPVSAADRTGVV
jgi:hypothetical protein